jgi:hypothetical protein
MPFMAATSMVESSANLVGSLPSAGERGMNCRGRGRVAATSRGESVCRARAHTMDLPSLRGARVRAQNSLPGLWRVRREYSRCRPGPRCHLTVGQRLKWPRRAVYSHDARLLTGLEAVVQPKRHLTWTLVLCCVIVAALFGLSCSLDDEGGLGGALRPVAGPYRSPDVVSRALPARDIGLLPAPPAAQLCLSALGLLAAVPGGLCLLN